MIEDFDEDTLETIEPIRQMRLTKFRNENLHEYIFCLDKTSYARKFLKQNNIFLIPRTLYEKSKTDNIEALLTKFNEIIIDDTNKPYIIKPEMTKKELAVHIAKKFNKTNLNKGLGYIHKTTDMISGFADSIGTQPKRKKRYKF